MSDELKVDIRHENHFHGRKWISENKYIRISTSTNKIQIVSMSPYKKDLVIEFDSGEAKELYNKLGA